MECHRPQGRQEGRSQETTQRFSESCEQQASVQRTQNDEVLSTWERPLVPRHTTGRKLDHYFVPFPLVHDTLRWCRLLETSAEAPALKFDSKLLIDSILWWWGWHQRSDDCGTGCVVWWSLFEAREVARLANYLGIDPREGSLYSASLCVSSEGGEWGNNTAIYSSANPAFFVSPTQTSGVLNCYSIASNMLYIHWHFNLVYHGELENLMSDTLTQGNVLAHRNSVYLPLSMRVLIVWLLTHSDAVIRMWSYAMLIVRLSWLAGC